MPLFEFKCLDCDDVFEILVMNNNDTVELACPKCKSENFERVLSTTNYSVNSQSKGKSYNSQTRTCSSGSCTTYELPGYSKS